MDIHAWIPTSTPTHNKSKHIKHTYLQYMHTHTLTSLSVLPVPPNYYIICFTDSNTDTYITKMHKSLNTTPHTLLLHLFCFNLQIQPSVPLNECKHTMNFIACKDSSFLSANAHSHSHRHLWSLSMECCHLCGVEWEQRSPLATRCMQLNRIRVVSPTEVIVSRWLAHRNMLLMKLLSHYGCVLVWRSMHDCTHVCICLCVCSLPNNCNTWSSTWLDSSWSFSCSITINPYCWFTKIC